MGEALLKVLLVDDEPFILQGLKILIDWEQEGFEVVKTAANGEEALEYLRGEQVDLIIADIKMPVVTGLELLEKIRGEKISDAHFVILSGYADFEYARKAIRYDCTDYILKPVDREELLKVLNKVQVLRRADNQKKQSSREMEQAYLSRHLIALIQGKFDSVNLEYVKSHMDGASGIRYVEIQMDDDGRAEEISDKEKRGFHDMLCDTRVVYEKKVKMYLEYQSAAGPQMSVQSRGPVQSQPGQPYRAVPGGGYSFVSDAGQVKKEFTQDESEKTTRTTGENVTEIKENREEVKDSIEENIQEGDL